MTRAHLHTIAAAALVAAVVAPPALAQGKSKKKTPTPGTSALPASTVIAAAAGNAPFAWIDDASVLLPGGMVVALSMMRWHGDGANETQLPIVDVAVGLTSRVQLGLSVPHIVDATDAGGASGGIGTTYVSTKVSVLDDTKRGVRMAVLPTLEILGAGVIESNGVNRSRVRWGVPVSVELSRASARLYGSSGYFSPGVWFAGAGAGFQPAARVAVSASFSRAWASAEDVAAPRNMRNDLSGGVSFMMTPRISLFGSLGHTVATTIENGAGRMLGLGVSLVVPSSR